MSEWPDGREPRRNPLVTVLMIVLGLPLLLPGACSAFFTSHGVQGSVAGMGFVIAVIGIGMIGFGIRRLVTYADVTMVSEGTKLVALFVLLVVMIVGGLWLSSLIKELAKVRLQ